LEQALQGAAMIRLSGYIILAVLIGTVIWYLSGQRYSWPLGVLQGAGLVAAVVIGNSLWRRVRSRVQGLAFVGYSALAVAIGAMIYYTGPAEPWYMAAWHGVCIVAGVVLGMWLRGRRRLRVGANHAHSSQRA
jgi:hypothetical protein